MKSFTTIAAVAALATSTLAATVVLKEEPCIVETELAEYTVQTGELFVKEITEICGLSITSVDPPSLQNSITCRAFIDAAGTQPGSAKFRWGVPALISTNPVQEGSILCEIDANATSLVPMTSATMTTSVTSVTSVTSLVGTAIPTGETGGKGNATITTGSPSATKGGESATATGAAGAVRASWGVGALVLAIVGMVV